MTEPEWPYLKFPQINYQDVTYYSAPKSQKKLKNLDEVDPELLETFEKLGISLTEQKRLANVAVDAVFDSVSIGTTFQEELSKHGVIFASISEAIHDYPELIEKYLGSVVPIGDNYFSALNSAVFTDGSFCYIPQDTRCPLDLSTYFRINDQNAGQFERTLIIAEKNSYVNYLEGCTAPQYDTNQLHAAIVELIAFENATIKYSTVQNWYAGDEFGKGGIYNFVTKRGLCAGANSTISWTQVETGSSITWKYPSCILMGDNSQGEFYSVALTNNYQQADTGTKMIHIGQNSRSRIISKGIIDDNEILKNLNLKIHKGEIHAIMGPNGSGKSTFSKVLAGHPAYSVLNGDILFKGSSILELEPEERAHLGIFLAFQYPIEIPGVSNEDFLRLAYNSKQKFYNKPEVDPIQFLGIIHEKLMLVNMPPTFLSRNVNEGFSGGEKKRNEILQMILLDSELAILDETDSGLDIDALKTISSGINMFMDSSKSILLITHYQRLLDYIKPDFVHVFQDGKIIKTGSADLAKELENKGYEWLK